MSLPDGLVKLAGILADWVEPAPGFDIFLFGSRVRGDHGPTSDVDVVIPIPRSISDEDENWWIKINEDDFKTINDSLPGPLQIQEAGPIATRALNAKEVHRDRQVRCVWMAPKNRVTTEDGDFWSE